MELLYPSNLTSRNYGHICTEAIWPVFHKKVMTQGADYQALRVATGLESSDTFLEEVLHLRLAKFILVLPRFWTWNVCN